MLTHIDARTDVIRKRLRHEGLHPALAQHIHETAQEVDQALALSALNERWV